MQAQNRLKLLVSRADLAANNVVPAPINVEVSLLAPLEDWFPRRLLIFQYLEQW
jgi:hypothetical protein